MSQDASYSYLPTKEDHERAMDSLLETLDLQTRGTDEFEGPSQRTPHGRVYGGQVLGQALRAAGLTIDPDIPAHSMHAYFLRAGDAAAPITFTVERLRDGRSFSARRVEASQHGKAILSMIASFQRPDEDALEHHLPMPQVAAPETLPSFAETLSHIDDPLARFMAQSRPFDIRTTLPPIMVQPDPEHRAENAVWMRAVGQLPDDPRLLQCVLAYASDYTLLESALRAHGLSWVTPMKIASLDHAMWFHNPVPADQWLLYVQRSPFSGGGRALGSGNLYTPDGTVLASVAQEGMVRRAAPGQARFNPRNDPTS